MYFQPGHFMSRPVTAVRFSSWRADAAGLRVRPHGASPGAPRPLPGAHQLRPPDRVVSDLTTISHSDLVPEAACIKEIAR
jgi:hypothetical protein